HIPALFAFLAIAAEFFGGQGLIFGFLTRIAAFGIFSNMIVAVAMVHHNFGFFMNWTGAQKGEGYEYHLLVLAITACLMIRGAGAASLDRLLSSSAGQKIQAQAACWQAARQEVAPSEVSGREVVASQPLNSAWQWRKPIGC